MQVGQSTKRYFVDYYRLTETVLNAVLSVDTQTPLWPSSPSNGLNDWSDPTVQDRGGMPFINLLGYLVNLVMRKLTLMFMHV